MSSSRLIMSENGRFLTTADGRPFFWLGDTAWSIFQRCTREEVDLYLQHRANTGFTVIQACLTFHSLQEANPYGEVPLLGGDPTRPNEAYFKHVDGVLDRAEALGLVFGLLPTWGSQVSNYWGEDRAIFTPANARTYGEFLGRRYRDRPIVWVLGGDSPPLGPPDTVLDTWRAMAEGLHAGDGGAHLMTYHPQGQHTSGMWLHDEPWLDFNMCQSGHFRRSDATYAFIQADYARTPTKPCIDGEPCYEDACVHDNAGNGRFDNHDVRKAAYWNVFAGACGHTYGCNNIWQMQTPERPPAYLGSGTPWQASLDMPGALDMQHLRSLMESRPFLSRIPDQSVILSGIGRMPGVGGATDHVQATRDGTPGQKDASYILIYLPILKELSINTSVIAGDTIRTWWYDPREGTSRLIGEFPNRGTYATPKRYWGPDWVLVVDDAAHRYAAPGTE